jgi:predicted HAD superfamily Cof-like phosphohydrolase
MLSKTNYEKVLDFNRAFGVKINKTPQLNLFDVDPKLVNYRLELINEEVNELRDAVKTKDFKETVDALSDILYVTYGAFSAYGINADEAFDLVQNSNMSKLCKSEEDAIETVQLYKTETPKRYDTPNYRRADDGVHWVVYNESTMKILKNYKYNPVDFSSLM